MAFRPLSTYTTTPVTAEASGEARKAAAFPTSSVQLTVGIITQIYELCELDHTVAKHYKMLEEFVRL